MRELEAGNRSVPLEPLLEEHARAFETQFGPGEGPRQFFSPGRVNLFGGHLDYNGGPVMPAAIDRGTFISVRPRSDRLVRIASTLAEDGVDLDLDALPDKRKGRWVDYPVGVILDIVGLRREEGIPCGLEILFGGNLPIGAGLSSSASICVGTALALDTLWGIGLDAAQRVHCALRAEREFVGVHCGIMDPFAVGFARPGHLLWLDCKDASFEHLPIDFGEISILVANSGVQREVAAGEFNLRVSQCLAAFEHLAPFAQGAACLRDVPLEVLREHGPSMDAILCRRARHVLEEVQRTFTARAAVLAGDFEQMGKVMTLTHESLRDLYEVSSPELDVLVEAARDCPGALGARLTGAGFGGCTVTLVRQGAEAQVAERLLERFRACFDRPVEVAVFEGDEGPRELSLS